MTETELIELFGRISIPQTVALFKKQTDAYAKIEGELKVALLNQDGYRSGRRDFFVAEAMKARQFYGELYADYANAVVVIADSIIKELEKTKE